MMFPQGVIRTPPSLFPRYSSRCKIKYDSYLGGEVQDAIVCCVDQTHRLLV